MHDPANPNTLSSNSVISICEDQQGTLWMGTFHGGLSRMKDGKFKTYLPDATNPYSISNRNIWYVHEDSRQNLWLATLSSGLDLFDRKSERFYHFTHDAGDSTSLCNNSLYGIYEDSRHDLYVTSNYGVSIIDLKAYDFSKAPTKLKFRNLLHVNNKNSLSSSNVYCVREDNEGNLWFGTMGSGIDLLDVSTGKFTNYSTNDGLPGNSITSILVDSENYLWLATDKGLAKFDPRTKEVVVFDPKDGLQNMGFKSWAIQTKDGEMFFGGPDGFNSFYPEKIKKNINHNIAPVVITGLKIFNNPVEINQRFHQRILLPTAISKTSELVLTHSENFFTFEFIALDYTTPGKNQYAYKMEGFDKEWVQCGTKREANYTNLDPGEYTFRVKAANNDGVWNENGTSLKVIILPNWWQTWWFRLILAFGVICIFLTIYYSRIRQFKNQQILLEKLVLQKTSELRQMNSMLIKQAEELNQTNTLLEVRQGQIEEQSEELSAQKESLVEMNNELHDLNATKDKFFSIIAHDIKNPFNAILGFTNLLEQNFSEWTDEMKLEIISLVHSSSKNLYQLLDNLLQWSRSQRGIIEFNPEKTALKELLYKVIELMNGTAEAKNIELKVILPENELIILADRQMLDTILRNLIGNALKFTHTEGMVQVTAEAKDGFVLIKVADNGVGMSNEIKEKLFRIDVNYSSPGTQNEIGTGLGLILVKEFVEKHGGMIGVDSIEGKGSTFYFTLPLSKM
jgi:signal transduction histidine kinase